MLGFLIEVLFVGVGESYGNSEGGKSRSLGDRGVPRKHVMAGCFLSGCVNSLHPEGSFSILLWHDGLKHLGLGAQINLSSLK